MTGANIIYDDNKGGPINIFWNREIAASASPGAAKNAGDGSVYNPLLATNGRTAMFYRLSATDFTDTFEKAWENTDLQCDKGTGTSGESAINKQDGRAYQLSIREKRVNEDASSGNKQLFDYPSCTL